MVFLKSVAAHRDRARELVESPSKAPLSSAHLAAALRALARGRLFASPALGRKGHRPVHEVQVDIVQLEALEALLQAQLDAVAPVEGVPKLAGDEELLALHLAALEEALQGVANLRLVVVVVGAVKVAVANLERVGVGRGR